MRGNANLKDCGQPVRLRIKIAFPFGSRVTAAVTMWTDIEIESTKIASTTDGETVGTVTGYIVGTISKIDFLIAG